MNAQAFEIVIHAGPGKTATTSIQEFLAANVAELRNLGWHYVLGPDIPAAHHIPARLLDWDPRMIGTRVSDLPLLDELAEIIEQAKSQGTFKVLISSECLAKMTRGQWTEFVFALEQAAVKTNSTISKVTVTHTKRDFEKRVSSSYAEGLKRGLKIGREQGEELVRKTLRENDAVIYGLADLFTVPYSLQIIDFSARGEYNSFVAHWVSEVVDPRLAQAAAEFNNNEPLNARDSVWTQNRLLEFNIWNTPDSYDPFHPFLVASEDPDASFATMQRLILYYGLIRDSLESDPTRTQMAAEIDALRESINRYEAQNKELRNSLSWKVTAPLRAVARLFGQSR